MALIPCTAAAAPRHDQAPQTHPLGSLYLHRVRILETIGIRCADSQRKLHLVLLLEETEITAPRHGHRRAIASRPDTPRFRRFLNPLPGRRRGGGGGGGKG